MTCSSYESRLVYSDKGAGISDRLQVMESLSRLAVSLCALLAMDAPCHALKRGHNRGKNVSCALGWGHYVQISHEGMNTLNSTMPLLPALRLGSEDARADLALARATARRNATFIWKFPYYHAAVGLIRIPRAPVEVAWARNFSVTADLVLQTLPTLFSTLHIRRRDTVGECDTSIRRVVDYVKCALVAPIALLLYTDERSKEYIRPLLLELQQVGTCSPAASYLFYGRLCVVDDAGGAPVLTYLAPCSLAR